MTDLVTIQNNQPVTSSRIVAEKFEKRHKNVIQAIENIKAENSALTACYFETTYQAGTGKHYKEYLMNQKGFSILVMGFTGKKARQWQSDFYDAFESAVAELQRIKFERELERRNAEYLEVRNATKHSFTKLTDAIKENVIPIMEREGASESGKKFVYKNYVDALQKSFGIAKGTRDKLPIGLLYELDRGQSIASVVIQGLTSAGKTSKEIYSGTKAKLNDYAKLSFINERFLSVQ